MNLPFKDRIALHFVLTTAALILAAYLVVFGVVYQQVYRDLDANLRFEAAKHMGELTTSLPLRFANKAEWQEREHREVQVNPVFIQVTDLQGHLLDRSPNLHRDRLAYEPSAASYRPLNSTLRGQAIRQVQVPVVRGRRPAGYLLAAISSEAAMHVLASLRLVLLASYPVVLLALFASARLLAGRSIAPLTQFTATANRITRRNLGERLALPARPDELHTLATAINGLLTRVEAAVEREKQFTADASHELRTPLAALRGTLEVLVRKPRTPAEYVAQIGLGIQEIDRLTHLVEQLLLLARFEHQAKGLRRQELALATCVHDILYRHRQELTAQHLRVDVTDDLDAPLVADPFLVELILDNVLTNARKYSPAGATITVTLTRMGEHLRCQVSDQGIGIAAPDLAHIFTPLYRADALSHKHISGTGLGLSIVAKAAALLGVELAVQSTVGEGTTFTLDFPRR